MQIRVLIADDDALIREGLKIILQTDDRFEVADCVDNGLKAVEYCSRHQVDVALLDVRMPVMDGLEAARQISSKTETKPLILTTFDDDDFIIDAVKNGARGYLLKSSPPARIMDAITIVHDGGTVMQDVAMDIIKGELSSGGKCGIPDGLLTEREKEIAALVAKGFSNRDIAARLYMSEGTVKNYISAILGKTGLEHRTQLAIYYLTGKKEPGGF
ncbi:MAG: response regulator transcription factor [Acetivibrionales bacterium]|jgi:DNA-binding NarL/FixJ family response regulator|nr:response regulator transcription factor [Bacillota bacterium]NLP07742.1 response regulator transcription factor [Clostridiaceae bacterium]